MNGKVKKKKTDVVVTKPEKPSLLNRSRMQYAVGYICVRDLCHTLHCIQ